MVSPCNLKYALSENTAFDMNSQANIDKERINAYGKVAVLMGGKSAEREISLQTGTAVHKALRNKGVDAHAIDVGDNIINELVEGGFDRVFIALHGRGGEDGSMQGALQLLGLPYTGSGVTGSALAMDKVRSKWIWQAKGLPTPPFVEIVEEEDVAWAATEVGFPMMIKPVHEGSSCGAAKVTSAEQLQQAWRTAAGFDRRVMAERWITGAEYTAAILGDQVLPLIKLETPREFYDYEAKYTEETTKYICPCGLSADREAEIAALCLRVFELSGASGWGRVDLMMDKAGAPWFIEVNTVPGMTSHSLVPMAAKQAGISFDDLVLRILDTSMNRLEMKVVV